MTINTSNLEAQIQNRINAVDSTATTNELALLSKSGDMLGLDVTPLETEIQLRINASNSSTELSDLLGLAKATYSGAYKPVQRGVTVAATNDTLTIAEVNMAKAQVYSNSAVGLGVTGGVSQGGFAELISPTELRFSVGNSGTNTGDGSAIIYWEIRERV